METNPFIHETACVDEGSIIGEETKIWHYCHVMKGAEIGSRCTLGQNVFVANEVKIGNNVKIQNNVSLFTGVICEDDVFLGPSMVFTNVMNPRSAISRRGAFKQTIVRRGATIGANATILCGLEIGQYAFIGAGAVITSNVSSYALMKGNPGRQDGWMSEYGMRMEFDASGVYNCPWEGKTYILKDGSVEMTGKI